MKQFLATNLIILSFLISACRTNPKEPTERQLNEISRRWDTALVGSVQSGINLHVDVSKIKDTANLKSIICKELKDLIEKYSYTQLSKNYSSDTRIEFDYSICTFNTCNYKADNSCYAEYKYWTEIHPKRTYTIETAPPIFKRFILLDVNNRKNDKYKGMIRFYIKVKPSKDKSWDNIDFNCFMDVYLTKMNQQKQFVAIQLPVEVDRNNLEGDFKKSLRDYMDFILSTHDILKYAK